VIIVLKSPNAGLDALARGLGDALVVDVDITDMRSVRSVVAEHRPSAVVSSVWRDHRAAECDPEAAFRYDGEAAINLAAAALEFGATACLLSVADVFGVGSGPFDEDAAPAPASEYADAARRAEVFFIRAMRSRGLVVRSGPWIESIEAEIRAGSAWPGGVRIQPVSAESVGRFVAKLLQDQVVGTAHAVPPAAAREASEVYAEVASRLGAAASALDPDSPLAPSAVLSSQHHPTIVEPVSTFPSKAPEASPADGPEAGASASAGASGASDRVSAEPLIVAHAGVRLARWTGHAGDRVDLSTAGRRVSLWLRSGKGVVERSGREDEVLGVQRVLTVDGDARVGFAPVTDFELFVLSSPSSDAPADDPSAALLGDDGEP